MNADIQKLLRPRTAPGGAALDVGDIRRRVTRRRRTRAFVAGAVVVLLAPLAWKQLPTPPAGVAFTSPGAGTQDAAGGGEGIYPSHEVLRPHGIDFVAAAPPRDVLTKKGAIKAARESVGDARKNVTVAAQYGLATDIATGRYDRRPVWAVRFFDSRDTSSEPNQLATEGSATSMGVTVVLVDAAAGDVLLTATMSSVEGMQQEAVTDQLGDGTSGRSSAAEPADPLGQGRTPRLAAIRAAKNLGRRDVHVRSVVFIADSDTRVLIDDSTGCWVYAAARVNTKGRWEASGGDTPCEP